MKITIINKTGIDHMRVVDYLFEVFKRARKVVVYDRLCGITNASGKDTDVGFFTSPGEQEAFLEIASNAELRVLVATSNEEATSEAAIHNSVVVEYHDLRFDGALLKEELVKAGHNVEDIPFFKRPSSISNT